MRAHADYVEMYFVMAFIKAFKQPFENQLILKFRRILLHLRGAHF